MGLQLPKRARRIGLVAAWPSGAAAAGLLLHRRAGLRSSAWPARGRHRPRPTAIHDLWMGAWLAAMIVGVMVWGLIGYACVKFRRRSDDEIPVQTRYNLPIEILYTVAPGRDGAGVLLLHRHRPERRARPAPTTSGEADHGRSWSASSGVDLQLRRGRRARRLDHGVRGRHDRRPAHARTCPVDKSVEVELRSPDVIHSFWVPAFLFKMDVVPGASRQPLQLHADPRGHVRRPVRRAVRRLPLADAVQRQGGQRGRVRSSTCRSSQKQGNIGPALGGSEVSTQSGLEGSDQTRRRRVTATAEGAQFQGTSHHQDRTRWASRSSRSSRPPTTR